MHLKTEHIQSQTEFVSLTTALTVNYMINAWWGELKSKDVTSLSQQAVKFNSVFKERTNALSLCPYLSLNDEFYLDNPAKPVEAFKYFLAPPKQL